MEDTEQNLAKAYLLGGRSQPLRWDYGRLAEREHPQEAIKVLSDLLKLQPERTDVRIELAAVQLSSNQSADALATLAPIKTTTPQDAPRVFTLLAYAQLGAGQRDQAANSVARLAQYAATPEDRDRADQLKRYLDQPNPPALIPSTVMEGTAHVWSGELPRLSKKRKSLLLLVLPLDCSSSLLAEGQRATIVLETDQGRKRFLLEGPAKVTLVAADGAHVQDSQCGPANASQDQNRVSSGPRRPEY
jgi:hypothetical protein